MPRGLSPRAEQVGTEELPTGNSSRGAGLGNSLQTRSPEESHSDLHRARMDEAAILARRMREINGRALDAEDLEAISEATGVDSALLSHLQEAELGVRRGPLARMRDQYAALNSDLKSVVGAGALALPAAFLLRANDAADAFTSAIMNARYGILAMAATVVMALAAWAAARARTPQSSALAGLAFGTVFAFGYATFALLFGMRVDLGPTHLLAWAASSAAVAAIAQGLRRRLMPEAQDRRHELLSRMQEIREELRSAEEFVCFLSVDIVGSTRLKSEANPLDAEYTLHEYKRYVEMVAAKYGGELHSTAGDGVTLLFPDPSAGFLAAKNLQLGLGEFNAHRNKLGRSIEVRCGLHAGAAMIPDARDRRTLNYAEVIDVAAHLQKACPPGGVAVSAAAAARLPGGLAGVGEGRVGDEAAVWLPRRAVASPAPSMLSPATSGAGGGQ